MWRAGWTGEIRLDDGPLTIGPEAEPDSDLGDIWEDNFNLFSLETTFLPAITLASTPPCDELLTRATLFSDDPFSLCALVVFLRFNKSAPLIAARSFVNFLLGVIVSTSADFVAWLLLPIGELERSLLGDGVGNSLGTVCGTPADGPESAER